MAYRKRRSRGTWFPTFSVGAATDGGDTVAPVATIQGQIQVRYAGQASLDVHPLTIDVPQEDLELTTEDTLSDVLANEYVLKRIVGKFSGVFFNNVLAPSWAQLTVGFFVARAAESPNRAIGMNANNTSTATPEGLNNFRNYSPLSSTTMREPWLWRRTWLLGNRGHTANSGAYREAYTFPASTNGYGSVMDGPHVDAKTIRKVGQDDRLWMAVAAVRWPVNDVPDPFENDGAIQYSLDYRLFGSLRKARQVGRF